MEPKEKLPPRFVVAVPSSLGTSFEASYRLTTAPAHGSPAAPGPERTVPWMLSLPLARRSCGAAKREAPTANDVCLIN